MIEEITYREAEGFLVGSVDNQVGKTGLTLVLAPKGAIASCDVRGGSPATRETDLLSPENKMEKIHGVLISGGSSFGLNSASGVMEALEKRKIGYDVGVSVVPIISGASIFDLACGDPMARPDHKMGLDAVEAAFSGNFKEGSHGAGTGATCSKVLFREEPYKSGQGFCGLKSGEVFVCAISVVNALGDIYHNGKLINGSGAVCEEVLSNGFSRFGQQRDMENTTISCIFTNGRLTKGQCKKAASVAHDGYARAIRPVHTSMDGDTIFVMSTGEVECDFDKIATMATKAVEEAIARGGKGDL